MSKLIGIITGNPLVLLWIVLGAFAAGAASGGSVAWWIQGLNVTSVEQELTEFKQEQTRVYQEAQNAADIQRTKAAQDYAAKSEDLAKAIEAGDVYRRCVAAGKCGVRVLKQPTCTTGIRLPAADSAHDLGTDAISLIARAAEEDPVVNDCASTTLMLNQLQTDIENQPGYTKEQP